MLAALSRKIDALNRGVGVAASWLTTVLMLLVCLNVFTRYALDITWIGAKELEWHLFAAIFLFGAAWTLQDDEHVRVDLIYARLGPKAQAAINLAGSLLLLIPFCVLVIWVSLPFIEQSWLDAETSPDDGGLPARYLIKACIPAGFVFLLLQGVSLAIRSLLTLIGRDE